MLNFIYYPVSGIMWVWHWLFDHITPDTPGGNGVAWALSVVFLVFTLRAILYKPFVKQIRTTKKMQEINPQLQAIRKKYAKDRVKMTEEMQKLQKEHGFNPLLGCLPMLLQIPVFIGLFHVLRSFNRMGTGMGQLKMSAEQTRATGNYFFSPEQVQNFLDARLFGVPLSAYITEPTTEFKAFVESGSPIDFTRPQIAIVVVPMMIIASIATYMNSRASVKRQPAAALENPQTRMMNMLAQYVFPLGILVTGPFFPVAILLYWMSNNIWTYGQQHIVFGRIEREEEEAKQAKLDKQKANAPKPGARPGKGTKPAAGVVDSEEASEDLGPDASASAIVDAPATPLSRLRQRMQGRKPATTQAPAGSNEPVTDVEATNDVVDETVETTAKPVVGGKPATGGKQAVGQTKSGTAHVANKKRKSNAGSRKNKKGRPGGR